MSANSSEAAVTAAGDLSVPRVRKYWVLAVVSLTIFMVWVDATVVNTALPSIARDFGATNSELQWIVNSYSLLLAGLLLLGGAVGDRFGRKRSLTAGAIMFGAASLGASLSTNPEMLIFMRGIQGVGAAFMLPGTLSIISSVFEREERAKAIAIWAMVGSMAAVAGPALGGSLVDQVGWEAVFWLHVPIDAVIVVGMKMVPESKDTRSRPLDITGAMLATIGMLALVFGVVQGGGSGWTSVQIIISFVMGGSLLGLFWFSQSRNQYPMLPLRYLTQGEVAGPILVLLILILAMAGVFFFLTQYFQLVQGHNALRAGLYIMPAALTMPIGATAAARFSRLAGPKLLAVIGGFVVMGGLGALALIEVDSNYVLPAIGFALFGLGSGLIMPTVSDTIMAAISPDDAGIGAAMNDTGRELGFALGVAVLGAVLTSLYRTNVTDNLHGLVPADIVSTIGDSLGSLSAVSGQLVPEVATTVAAIANQAFVDAMRVSMFTAIGFVAIAIVIALIAIPRKVREHQARRVET